MTDGLDELGGQMTGMSTPAWSEACYCKRCDLSFTSDTPDAICPKCGMTDQLFDSKELS